PPVWNSELCIECRSEPSDKMRQDILSNVFRASFNWDFANPGCADIVLVSYMRKAPGPSRLAGWKEIGRYLGVDARTAQRWERERQLPVERTEGEKSRV